MAAVFQSVPLQRCGVEAEFNSRKSHRLLIWKLPVSHGHLRTEPDGTRGPRYVPTITSLPGR